MGNIFRRIGRAIDPTKDPSNLILPVAIANGATAAAGHPGAGVAAAGPYAAQAGATSSGRSPLPGSQPEQSAPGAGMVDRSRPGPGAIRPEMPHGIAPGYAMNPYQKALAEQLSTRRGPGIQQGGDVYGAAGQSAMQQLTAALRNRGGI